MRLIDADALIRELMSIKVTFGSGNGLVEGGIEIAISTTNAQPTVDAVERKKGKWDFIGFQMFRCTACKHVFSQDSLEGWRTYTYEPTFPIFCPNCGADMRGENNG